MSSNTRSIQSGRQDNTLRAVAYNTDGSVKTDLAHNTTGISILVQRIGAADGSPLTLSAKASASTAHADGAFLNLGGGDISVDIPDAPVSGYVGQIRIYGTFTGGYIVGEWFDVVGFDASVAAVGALTTLGTNAPANWINAAAIASNAITDTKINDGALTAAKFASGAFDAVWSVTARTLSAISDSAGITTLLTRITGLLQTKSEADTDQAATIAAIGGIAPLDATQTQAASAAAITAADLATKTDVQNASLL